MFGLHKNIRFLILVTLASLGLKAQKVCSFALHFPVDQYTINTNCKVKIDSVIAKLSNVPQAYLVEIKGYTDNTGSEEKNRMLSQKRAEETQKYFVQKKFLVKNITRRAFADSFPVSDNLSENGKSKNRRVIVEISVYNPDIAKILNIKSLTEVFKINAGADKQCKYSSGTVLDIPANIFETQKGKTVTGDVEIKYTEYRNSADFLFSGIPMSFIGTDGQLTQFNSAGMFKIEAFQNDEPLKMKTNSTIGIKFATTQNLPNQNFYSLNEKSSSWKEEKPCTKKFQNISAIHGLGLGKHIASCVKKYYDKDTCSLYPFTGNILAIQKGMELAAGNLPIDLHKSKFYFKKIKGPPNKMESFRMKIENLSGKKAEFSIIPNDSVSVFDDFRNYVWTYKNTSKNPFNSEWGKACWLRISVFYIGKDNFTLTFTNNVDEFTLYVKGKKKGSGPGKKEAYRQNEQNRYNNLQLVLELASKQSVYEGNFDYDVEREDSIFSEVYNNACHDSLFCFYQYNRQWADISSGEGKMRFSEWIDYFNANHKLFAARYQKIKSKLDEYKEGSKAEEKKRVEEEKQRQRRSFVVDSMAGRKETVLDGAFKALCIDNLGVWNCDQIQRLKDPVYVKKKYVDEQGNSVTPIVVYVIDKEVSGTLTYDGYSNLSPYYFPVSSKSKNTLIALDDNNRFFICTPALMAEYVNASNTSAIKLVSVKKENPGEQIAALLK